MTRDRDPCLGISGADELQSAAPDTIA